jgi:hypothetical protein
MNVATQGKRMGWFGGDLWRIRAGVERDGVPTDVLQYPRSYSTIFQQKKVYFVLWESKQRALYIY